MTRYGFQEALGAFFLAGPAARRLLPPGLVPLEARPGHPVLAVTAFDFAESEVGAYRELVISVLVPPFAGRGAALPHASTFPIALFTTTEASRAHAAARWLLPEHERCLHIDFRRDGERREVTVRDGDAEVLALSVRRRSAPPVTARRYQVFSARHGRLWRVELDIAGSLDEHQEETGRLRLGPHALTEKFAGAILDDYPIVEQSMDAGEQRFGELVAHLSERP